MPIKELLNAGRLGQAIEELTQQVKGRPADTSLRVSLFELLCFAGALDRAGKQLEVIATQGSGMVAEVAVQVYRDLLAAEQSRRDVFHGNALPRFLLPPPPYIEAHVLMVKKMQDAPAEALALLPAAEEEFPALPGRIAERSFSSIRDADDRLGPILEVFHGADYVWLPLEQIKQFQVSEPRSIRDLLWARVKIETYDQSVGDVVVPALYVDSYRHPNDQVRLGRLTEWEMVQDQLVWGSGQRMFLIDDREVPLLELRDVQLAPAASQVGA